MSREYRRPQIRSCSRPIRAKSATIHHGTAASGNQTGLIDDRMGTIRPVAATFND